MANTIKIKRSGTANTTPSSLDYGELAINYADGKLYYKNSSNVISEYVNATVSSSNKVAQGRLNANETVTANSDFVIPFIDDFDPNNWWNASTKKLTPTIAGYYIVSISVWWNAGSVTNNQWNTQIRKNGNTFALYQDQIVTGSGASQGGSKLVYLNGSTDYVDFTVYTGNSSDQTLQYGSSNGQGTYFSAALITAGAGPTGATGATGATRSHWCYWSHRTRRWN